MTSISLCCCVLRRVFRSVFVSTCVCRRLLTLIEVRLSWVAAGSSKLYTSAMECNHFLARRLQPDL